MGNGMPCSIGYITFLHSATSIWDLSIVWKYDLVSHIFKALLVDIALFRKIYLLFNILLLFPTVILA